MRFNQQDDDYIWSCGKAAQAREHLYRHGKKRKNELRKLWKTARRQTGWKEGRCKHVQISELFSTEKCDQAVMNFLAATEV